VAARVLIAEDELQAAVSRLGAEISAAYPDGLVAISVLKGSVLFFADLMRAITVPVEVDFLAISSYGEGTGRVRIVKDLDIDIHQRPTLLVEDIVDTGLTLTYILSVLQRRLPASLDVCTLLDKTARRIVPPPVRFVGFTIPDEFVLGYGLDFAERYRNLNRVIAGDLDALQSDPDAHVAEVYGG
jgi:hypoxanthine phosphoribosyltransferase